MRWTCGLLLAAGLAWGQADAPDPAIDLLGGLLPGDLPIEPLEPATAATIDGLWVLNRRDGPTRYLEIYAGRRFVYRDGRGNVTAGEARAADGQLTLTSQGLRRVFVYHLNGRELELIPDLTDRPSAQSPLTQMPPTGAAIVTYRRRGQEAESWSLPLDDDAVLLGSYTLDSTPGRRETLTFAPAGQIRYEGPGDVASEGSYAVADGLVVLEREPVKRALQAELWFAVDGWHLRLARAPEDHPVPANDLADLSPIFRTKVEYRRPLDVPVSNDLLGRYTIVQDGVTHRLTLLADGQARYAMDQDVMPLTWDLRGPVMTLTLSDELGPLSTRQLLVQRLAGGLVLLPAEDRATSPDPLLGPLPPIGQPYAYWTAE